MHILPCKVYGVVFTPLCLHCGQHTLDSCGALDSLPQLLFVGLLYKCLRLITIIIHKLQINYMHYMQQDLIVTQVDSSTVVAHCILSAQFLAVLVSLLDKFFSERNLLLFPCLRGFNGSIDLVKCS